MRVKPFQDARNQQVVNHMQIYFMLLNYTNGNRCVYVRLCRSINLQCAYYTIWLVLLLVHMHSISREYVGNTGEDEAKERVKKKKKFTLEKTATTKNLNLLRFHLLNDHRRSVFM